MPRYFSERGRNHEEVLDRIRKKYGDRARILMQKNVPGPGIRGLMGKQQVEYTGYITGIEEAKVVQNNRDQENRAAILASVGREPVVRTERIQESTIGIGSGPGNDNLDEVLKEIRDLKGRLSVSASTPPPEPFPHLTELAEILRENDFEGEYTKELLNTLRGEFTAADLEDREKVHRRAAHYIAESLDYFRSDITNGSRIFILIGPTGVGKTTTIAKLAAVHGLSSQGADVRIFTVDSFRIGARAQVETYGEIMGIPVKAVDDYDELKTELALASDADLILVDTIGKSPRDAVKIDEMRTLLSACGDGAEVHLALSSTTKSADLKDIMTQFESFSYQSVVLTKLDETSRIGNLVSAIASRGIPLSYLTDGQTVPLDIAVASPMRLLSRLKGLDYDRTELEERYPADDLTAAWR
jgi:flagellar biosynthesis protein FlhF